MTCLTPDRLYRYLDGDLRPEEAADVEAHRTACVRCRERIEESRALAQAASSLPDLELPAGFAESVMNRIVRAEAPHRSWLAILGIGLGALGVSLGTLILASGQSAAGLLLGFGRGSLHTLQGLVVLFLKFFKVLLLAVKILPELAGTGLRGLSRVSGSFPVEILAGTVLVTIALASGLLFAFRRSLFVQDDIGEDP
ncbi:MAG: zf-HC2 domain-containing protein [Candidatus Aminicenantes bacterium]|nr:zf-HC2 domain-containing protein [Candidatus Aminicenantes bacterium]